MRDLEESDDDFDDTLEAYDLCLFLLKMRCLFSIISNANILIPPTLPGYSGRIWSPQGQNKILEINIK